MKVTLIDYTGADSNDPMYAAKLLVYTKNTRLTQGKDTRAKVNAMSQAELEEELNYIANTIRSSWEFVDYTFEIKDVTRAFTHQLVRTRTASFAQQSQRSVDMDGFTALIPDSVYDAELDGHWHDLMDHINATYQKMRKADVPTEDARGVLPTNICTSIIAKMNLRTLADLLGKRKSLRAQGEYSGIAAEMELAVLEVHPWTKPFLSPDRLATPELNELLKKALGKATPLHRPKVNAALKELDKLKGTWG